MLHANTKLTLKATKSPLYILLFLSGCAGLGYELSWTHLFAAGFGSEITAVFAVIAAFFTGCALGGWGSDGYIRRSAAPWRWYAACEALIGIWALLLIFFIPKINAWAALFTGAEPSSVRHWCVSFMLPLLVLLPATAAMGATFPAMEKMLAPLRNRNGSVGGLYAANTLGACTGVIAATFLLIPLFGYRVTQILFIALNFTCSAGMLLYARLRHVIPSAGLSRPIQPARRLLSVLFLTGLLGVGYEVVLIRVMSQVLENTVYSFAAALSIYLFGTAAGAAVYQRFLRRFPYVRSVSMLMPGTAAACCAGIILIPYSAALYTRFHAAASGSLLLSVLSEFAFAGSVFLVPTLCMGALYSCLTQHSCAVRDSAGTAVAVNTLGASLSPLLFGVIALSSFGTKIALTASAMGYLLLMPIRTLVSKPAGLIALALSAAAIIVNPGMQFESLPEGISVVAHQDGVMASVTVLEDKHGDRYLKVNNRFQMGSTATQTADRRQAHIPLLLHPAPRRALFLGLGTGATFAAAAGYKQLVSDSVEIVPEIIEMLPLFEKATGDMQKKPMLRVIAADARRYVRACPPARYDVIIADLFHPSLDGAGLLYSVEHFTAIRRALSPQGIFCQWLPLYQLDAATLKLIIRSFLNVFPDASAFLCTYSIDMPTLGLVSGMRHHRYHDGWMESRIDDNITLSHELKSLRLFTLYDLFGCCIADRGELCRYAGHGDLNTDDRPLVVFKAPSFVYTGSQAPPYALLRDMLSLSNHDLSFILPHASPEARRRLSAYVKARDLFLRTGIAVHHDHDTQSLAARITGPLIDCVATSPDFTPAYEPLLSVARNIFATDKHKAHALLLELERINPYRNDARNLRAYLFHDGRDG